MRTLLAVAVGVALLAGTVSAMGAIRKPRGSGSATTSLGPVVGGDLHALAVLDGRVFVSGHGGAGVSDDGGRHWQQLPSLAGKDGMGWALTGSTVLVGGHGGLFASKDGSTFAPVVGLPVSDIHGLGAAGATVYVASPAAGLFMSPDGGRSWQPRGSMGRGIMGSIVVDAMDVRRLVAPDMTAGVVGSDDGGLTWYRLGVPTGAMSVDRNPNDSRELVAVGMGGAQRSADGGSSWKPMSTPPGVTAVAFLPGQPAGLVAAALDRERARVYVGHTDGVDWAVPSSG